MPEHPPFETWQALSVDEARQVFAPLGIRWWIAGGWAIDLFIGQQTRDHADIDIAILRRDHLALRALTADFDLYVAHDGTLTAWDAGVLPSDRHQFWARRRDGEAWAFEVLLEESDGDRWLFRREPQISLPLDEFGAITADGTPYVAPEVALLYKANGIELERNAADFATALPYLDAPAKHWLSAQLGRVYDQHAWLARLDMDA